MLPAAAGIALITPVIAFGLEMLALRRMTHTAFGTLLSIEPAFGVLIGLVVLAQAPSLMQLAVWQNAPAAGAPCPIAPAAAPRLLHDDMIISSYCEHCRME